MQLLAEIESFCRGLKNSLRRLSSVGYRNGFHSVRNVDSLPELARFLPLFEEIEQFDHWPQLEVAKIVQCGERYSPKTRPPFEAAFCLVDCYTDRHKK